MLWLLAAAALPVAPTDYAPELDFAPAQAREIRLRFRRPLRASPENFEVELKILEGGPRFRRLPGLQLERGGLRYFLQAPGAPASLQPGRERFVMQVDLSYGGKIRRRLTIRHRLRLRSGPGPDPAPLLDVEPSTGASERDRRDRMVRERVLLHHVLTSTRADVPAALAGLPEEPTPELTPLAPREQLVALVRALEGGRFGAAEAHAAALRSNGPLAPGELARRLELEAGLALLQGRQALARRRFQQALTLFPELETQHPSPYVRSRFDALRTSLQPDRPLSVGRIDLRREGGRVQAEVAFGPDSARLVERVELGIAEPDRALSSRASHEGAEGRASFEIEGLSSKAKRALVQVRLLDEGANILAEQGADRPLSVPVLRPDKKKVKVPSWVWWTTGIVVAAGAGTAIALVVADSSTPQPERNLGPFEIRF
ncbi:MAG: hypothetical protein AAGD10_19595 [Myxococcota bacterium]